MAIIGLVGARGSGRQTAAAMLTRLGIESIGFGTRLRRLLGTTTGIPDQLLGEKRDEPLPSPLELKPFHFDGTVKFAADMREVPASLATRMSVAADGVQFTRPRDMMDFFYDQFVAGDPVYWIEVLRPRLSKHEQGILLIDDVTTPEEQSLIRDFDGRLIGIERPGFEADLSNCDVVVKNTGSPTDLEDQVLSALVTVLRGTPLNLSAEAVVVATPVERPVEDNTAAATRETIERELEKQRAGFEALRTDLETKLAARDAEIAALKANAQEPKGAAADPADLTKAKRRVTTLETQLAGLKRQLSELNNALAADGDTPVLVARLASALGYRAGHAEDGGEPRVCVELPSGQVSWPASGEAYLRLPRFDKSVQELTPAERHARIVEPGIPIALETHRALENCHFRSVVDFVGDLVVLAEGCKTHRAYRAKRAPEGECSVCAGMWASGERLGRLVAGLAAWAEEDEAAEGAPNGAVE